MYIAIITDRKKDDEKQRKRGKKKATYPFKGGLML